MYKNAFDEVVDGKSRPTLTLIMMHIFVELYADSNKPSCPRRLLAMAVSEHTGAAVTTVSRVLREASERDLVEIDKQGRVTGSLAQEVLNRWGQVLTTGVSVTHGQIIDSLALLEQLPTREVEASLIEKCRQAVASFDERESEWQAMLSKLALSKLAPSEYQDGDNAC